MSDFDNGPVHWSILEYPPRPKTSGLVLEIRCSAWMAISSQLLSYSSVPIKFPVPYLQQTRNSHSLRSVDISLLLDLLAFLLFRSCKRLAIISPEQCKKL